MEKAESQGLWGTAYALSLLLRLSGLLTLVGTFYVAKRVSQAGSSFGITPSNDPATWVVLVGGIFATLMIEAAGFTLAMLCVIYERQAREAARTLSPPRGQMPSTSPRSRPPTVWDQVAQRDSLPPEVVRSAPAADLTGIPSANTTVRSSGMWYQLTRKRKWFGGDGT